MARSKPSPKGDAPNTGTRHRSEETWHFLPGDPTAFARKALLQAIAEIDSANKRRKTSIQKLRYLIYELQSIQPAELTQLAESLGQSLTTTRNQIRQLQRLDLVIRTEFESHTLYCTNGRYNQLIASAIVEGLFD